MNKPYVYFFYQNRIFGLTLICLLVPYVYDFGVLILLLTEKNSRYELKRELLCFNHS